MMSRFPIRSISWFSTAVAVLGALASVIPDVSQAFSGRRGTRIAPVNDQVFEVVTRIGGLDYDYWCGASDFARRVLGAAWTARIYVARGRGPSVTTGRRSAVQFTLDPNGAGIAAVHGAARYGLLSVGDDMSVQQAAIYCQYSSHRP